MNDQVLDKILTKLDNVDNKVDGLILRLDNVGNQIDSIAIKVVDIEEKLNTFATKDEMNEKFDLVLGNIDRFVRLHETLDQELASLRHKHSRLEERLEIVERKLQLA